MKHNNLIVKQYTKIHLSKISHSDTYGFNSKKESKIRLTDNIKKIVELQSKLFAQDK